MRGEKHQRSGFNASALAVLKCLLPDEADSVEKLTLECVRFREVCKDYLVCGEAIGRFEGAGEGARDRVREYSELKAELEKELRAMLESEMVCRSCGKKHRRTVGQFGG